MWKFIKNTFSSFLGTCLALFFLGVIGIFGLFMFLVMAGLQNAKPSVVDQSVLVLDLSMSINDKPPSESLDQMINAAVYGRESSRVGTRALLNAIHMAKEDDSIVGIFVSGNLQSENYGSGYGTLKELREALIDFKDSGKPVYGYFLNASKTDYYILSACSEVVMNPFGDLSFNGIGADMMFYAKAFEKWGIGVQVTRVGKFKGAVEPYIRENMSDENRQQTEEMIQGVWASMADAVADSRKLSVDSINEAANSTISFNGEQALMTGLVDRLEYFDVIIDEMRTLAGMDDDDVSFRQVNVQDYIQARSLYTPGFGDEKIAVVYAEGVIVGGRGKPDQVGGDLLARRLRALRQDDDVKAVVLRVNSPGGSAQASEVIDREIRLLKEKKPVIVSMGYVAASGGYWISANADHIFAEENTITGSIGVFGLVFEIEELSDMVGITWDSVQTHDYASAYTSTRPRTDAELAQIQKDTDFYYDTFIKKVAKGRGLEPEKVKEIAQGRVWLGYKAKEFGLVDELGGLEDAIAYAAEQADLSSYDVVDVPRYHTMDEVVSALLENRELDALQDSSVNQLMRKVESQLRQLEAFNDPKGIYLLTEELPQL